MPDIIRFALRVRPAERYELRVFGDFTRWSVFDRQCLVHRGSCGLSADGSLTANSDVVLNQPRNWRNTFALRVGGSYFFSPTREGLVGLGYDSNAIPAGTLDASLIDGHDLTYTVGAALSSQIASACSLPLAISTGSSATPPARAGSIVTCHLRGYPPQAVCTISRPRC